MKENYPHDDCPKCGSPSVPAERVPDQSLRGCPMCKEVWAEDLSRPAQNMKNNEHRKALVDAQHATRNQSQHTVEFRWLPEGDGFTLYRFNNGERGQSCGRLNTGAVGSTHQLAMLYAAAPNLLRQRDKLREALKACEEALSEVPCLSNKQESSRIQARAVLTETEDKP